MSPPPPPPSSFVYVRKIEYALAKASSGEKINSTFPNFPSGVVIFLLSYPCPVRSFIPPSMAHLYYTAHHASSLSTGVLYVACYRCHCSWLVVSRLFYIQKYICIFILPSHPNHFNHIFPITTTSPPSLLLLLLHGRPFLFPFSFVDVVSRPRPFLPVPILSHFTRPPSVTHLGPRIELVRPSCPPASCLAPRDILRKV